MRIVKVRASIYATIFILLFSALCTVAIVQPVHAKVSGKSVLIASGSLTEKWCGIVSSLLSGEGFETVVVSGKDLELYPELIEKRRDVYIFANMHPPVKVLSFVKSGSGLFIISNDDGTLGIAGVVAVPFSSPGIYEETSRIVSHPVTKSVRSFSFQGFRLSIASSDAYPLIIGNDKTWGVRDPVLMVANTYGEGRVIAIAPYTGGYLTSYFPLDSADNALLVKNAVYWLAKLDVPEFTRELPSLIEVEDRVARLSENLTILSNRLAEFERNLENMPAFVSLQQQVSKLIAQVSDVLKKLDNIATAQELTRSKISELEQRLSIAMGSGAVAIIISVLAIAVSRRKTRR
jgi:hypothetical protein